MVEKDYVLGWLLAGVAEHPQTRSWAFKRGTCLRKWRSTAGDHLRQKGNTPGACHEGISDTGELASRIRSIIVEFNHHVEQAISTPRLSTYRNQASSGDHAWALYRWNIDLAAAVAPLAADLEVTLRNTIHDRLTAHFGRADWWASASFCCSTTSQPRC